MLLETDYKKITVIINLYYYRINIQWKELIYLKPLEMMKIDNILIGLHIMQLHFYSFGVIVLLVFGK